MSTVVYADSLPVIKRQNKKDTFTVFLLSVVTFDPFAHLSVISSTALVMSSFKDWWLITFDPFADDDMSLISISASNYSSCFSKLSTFICSKGISSLSRTRRLWVIMLCLGYELVISINPFIEVCHFMCSSIYIFCEEARFITINSSS